jgi:DNA-binding beta-propeller fold protein YncE
MKLSYLGVAVSLASLAVPAAAQQTSLNGMMKGGTDDYGPYTPVPNWLKPVREGFLEKGVSVWAETPDHIFVTTSTEFADPAAVTRMRQAAGIGGGGGGGGGGGAAGPASLQVAPPRARALVSVHDRNGNVKEVWTQWEDLMVMPHYVTISPFDPEKNVWVVSRQTDGSFFVADGYDNRRVAKFDRDGKFLLDWGGVGTGPGQFAENGQVHSVAVDANRRVYVCDRGNNRIQIFDENGKFIDQWENVTGASDIKITTDGFAWVTSGRGNRLAKYDLNGKLITYWGTYGTGQGQFDDPHYISVDQEGNLYVAIFSNVKVGVEKYMPRAGADRTRLIGQFVVPGSAVR